MKKCEFRIFLALLLFGGEILLYAENLQEKSQREIVSIKNETFFLELAVTPESRRKGLMMRKQLDADGGMIFVFPECKIQRFWMANTLVDLDLIFLTPEGKITDILTMKTESERRAQETEAEYHARLPGYRSTKPVQIAIELQAGTADFLNLSVGDTISIDTERLLKLVK